MDKNVILISPSASGNVVCENSDFQNSISSVNTSSNINNERGSKSPKMQKLQRSTSSPNNSIMITQNTKPNVSGNQITATTSYFNTNFDENGYVFDGVKVEIEDIDNTSLSNITTQSLKRCKKQVLKHYYTLLCIIGWRPFYKEYFYLMPIYCSIINFFYPILIIFCLFYSYIYDILICQFKFIFLSNLQDSLVTTVQPTNMSRISGEFEMKNLNMGKQESNLESVSEQRQQYCGHFVTRYIIPSIIHFISYIIGFVYFRINDSEQLYALMEKVFLSVNQTMKLVSQDRVIKRLRIFIILGVLWILLSISMFILCLAVYGFELLFKNSWSLMSLEMVALIIMNAVYLAVVINHATQCEMIIFYVQEIRTRLEEKSITLKDAMQQILDINIAIGNLNSTVSKMTTLVSFTFLEKLIIGIINLATNKLSGAIVWSYRIIFPTSWFLILAFSLIQIARLNSKCDCFKQIAISARVYGFHASTRDELDSFLLFISNSKLRAKLFGIPVKSSYLIGALILLTFSAIILIQTSVLTTAKSFI